MRCCTSGASKATPGVALGEVGEDIAAGRLVSVLDAFAAPPIGIHAVFPQRRHLLRVARLPEARTSGPVIGRVGGGQPRVSDMRANRCAVRAFTPKQACTRRSRTAGRAARGVRLTKEGAMFRHILVPTDGSELSQKAIDGAIDRRARSVRALGRVGGGQPRVSDMRANPLRGPAACFHVLQSKQACPRRSRTAGARRSVPAHPRSNRRFRTVAEGDRRRDRLGARGRCARHGLRVPAAVSVLAVFRSDHRAARRFPGAQRARGACAPRRRRIGCEGGRRRVRHLDERASVAVSRHHRGGRTRRLRRDLHGVPRTPRPAC